MMQEAEQIKNMSEFNSIPLNQKEINRFYQKH
jgi:hypothetical protein